MGKSKELLRNTGGIWHQKHNMLQLNQLMLLAAHNHIRKKPGPLHTQKLALLPHLFLCTPTKIPLSYPWTTCLVVLPAEMYNGSKKRLLAWCKFVCLGNSVLSRKLQVMTCLKAIKQVIVCMMLSSRYQSCYDYFWYGKIKIHHNMWKLGNHAK